MADSEKLELDITAKDSASKVIDPLQKKVDQLEKAEPEIAVAADTKAASKSIDAITTDAKGLDKLNPEVAVSADTKGAGSDVDTFVRKLSKLSDADQIVTLALRAGAAQTELSQLMTDVAQLDADDPTIDVKLDRVNELTGQLDDLKSKMEGIRDTSIDPDLSGKVSGRFQEIEEGAGKAGDAVHSMAGNAIGDFAATASGVGPLGEALGQMTEAALAGEASIKQIATAGLGMGALSVGLLVVNKIMGDMAESAAHLAAVKAFRDDEVKAYSAAIEDGATVTETLNKRLADTKKLMATVKSSIDGFSFVHGQLDISEVMLKNGVSVDLFGKAIEGGTSGIANLRKALEASGASTKDVTTIISAAQTELDYHTQSLLVNAKAAALNSGASLEVASSASLSADAQRYAGQAAQYQAQQDAAAVQVAAKRTAQTEAYAAQQDIATKASAAAATQIDDINAAIQDNVDKLRADADALQDSIDTQRAATDSTFALHKATADYTDADKDLADALKAAGKNQAAQTVAYDSHTQAAIAVADATAKVSTETIKASGATETATQKVDTFNHSLADQATSKVPGANDAIFDYIGQVNNIPPEKLTDIKAQFNQDGDLDKAKAALDDASETRKAAIVADADTTQATTDLDNLVKKKRTVILTPILAGSKFASGGTVGPEGGIGGEAGPEIAELGGKTVLLEGPTLLPPGTKVTSTARTRAILQRRIPRYANGTGTAAALGFADRPFVFNYHQHAPVYGVADLDRHLDVWGRKIAATITAGRR